MVNRKERRLAGKTAANRRVKLDLIVEPSGDFGDSSNNEEVRNGGNAENHAESPNSPSSSDQRPENPLLLLGQYSDEEVEEESIKEISHDTRENSPAELDEQVTLDNHEGTKIDEDENLTAQKVNQENERSSSLDILSKFEENNVKEDNNKTESTHKDADAVDQASVLWTSDTPTTGDDIPGWKMVLHEESNSYYYWNIVTGETSWSTPSVLTQGNESTYDINNGSTEIDDSRPELEVRNEEYTNIVSNHEDEGNHVNTIDGRNKNPNIQDMNGPSSDSSGLLQLGESLLERLKSLKGSDQCNDQITKLTFELNIRLADIKSLVPYGSSLLPFWLHSENQLKKLEAAINNEVPEHSEFANIAENTIPSDIVPNVGPNSVDDDDMDVDMEVEDPIPFGNESGIQNEPQTDHESREFEEFVIPPPPNDDWIPPPPPDDEPVPPPPPDEPSEAAFPPPYPYGEQYGFTYPWSGSEYYGQTNGLTTEVPAVYYAAVPNAYTDVTSAMNPGEPVTCYTVEGVASDQTETSTVVSSVSGSTHVPETSTVTHDASTVAAPVVAPKESVSKVQPKVARTKKRTIATMPSLRSNKKVSGLVDKWKAVKEELYEDEEDEPENAYEVLEKKREREIEQWLAQQVATGEAKDNANFQPLGGDWRERVRQKRAKKSTKSEENIANADDTNKQPDLIELTKQLPSDWQAYWDEASKQVYYGNLKTSETTWIKPTT